jgi:hypothetical protein
MANPTLPRDHVHRISEECGSNAAHFQSIAQRILSEQPRLLRFFKANLNAMAPQTGEVSLYLLAVVVQIFARSGGKLGRVDGAAIDAATQRIQGVGAGLLPADKDFPARVRGVDWRAQPHILDEALHALFEREERKDNEVSVPPDQSALLFFMLWAGTEALDQAWKAPATPEWSA